MPADSGTSSSSTPAGTDTSATDQPCRNTEARREFKSAATRACLTVAISLYAALFAADKWLDYQFEASARDSDSFLSFLGTSGVALSFPFALVAATVCGCFTLRHLGRGVFAVLDARDPALRAAPGTAGDETSTGAEPTAVEHAQANLEVARAILADNPKHSELATAHALTGLLALKIAAAKTNEPH